MEQDRIEIEYISWKVTAFWVIIIPVVLLLIYFFGGVMVFDCLE